MKLLFTLLVASLLTITTLPEAQAAQTEPRMQFAEKRKVLQQKQAKKPVISKRSAIQAAQSQVKGKVLSAKLIQSRGPAVYRVKMLVSDKRVRTVFVDGHNGRVIRIN